MTFAMAKYTPNSYVQALSPRTLEYDWAWCKVLKEENQGDEVMGDSILLVFF